MATQTVNFIPPGSFTAIQSNIATLQTGTANLQTSVIALTGTISSQTTYLDKVGPDNVFTSIGSDWKTQQVDCWEFIKVYENLKNCMTGPNANKYQRAFADDVPTNAQSIYLNQTGPSVSYKSVKMSEQGVDGLAKQLLATMKLIHVLYSDDLTGKSWFYPAGLGNIKASQVNLEDENVTKNNLISLASTVSDYCTELIDGAYGELDPTLLNYIYTLRLICKSDVQFFGDEAALQWGGYNNYNFNSWKYFPNTDTLQSLPQIPLPMGLNIFYGIFGYNPPLSTDKSHALPNQFYNWYQTNNQQVNLIKELRALHPSFGCPPSMWGATSTDTLWASYTGSQSTIIQQKEAVSNGDGMGNTLPTGTFAAFGRKFNSTPTALPLTAYLMSGTFNTYQANNPLWGFDSNFLISGSLSNKLTSAQKQKIVDDCSYIFTNLCQPVATQMVSEQITSIFTNGKAFYDSDLWTNRWRYLIPGELLYCTGPSGPVEGTYTACVVNMTGVSSTSVNRIISRGASYLNEPQKIVYVPFSHPDIEVMVKHYKDYMCVNNCVFPGDTYISTYQITGTLNYNNYPSFSSVLNNYSVNVFVATGTDDFINGTIANGESSNQFTADLKYMLANQWIQDQYALSGAGGLFGGATGLDSYLPGTPINDKYNAVISNSLAEQTLLGGITSDLDVYGYHYGFIPAGVTGAAGDVAPVYVATGFSAPTFGTLSAQRANNGFTLPVQESLNTIYDVSIPMYFLYRQHYRIQMTGVTGTSAGQPLNASNTPTNNFRTEYATSTIYNTLRRNQPFVTKHTYLAAKEESFQEKLALATWNQAMTQQDIYNTGFINNYLLTSTGSSKYMKFRVQEANTNDGFNSAGGASDPLAPTTSYYFIGGWGNASPYSSSDFNFNANCQVFNHELSVGHGVQNLVTWYQDVNNQTVSPWTTNGQKTSAGWGNILGIAVNSAVNFEGWATFGEFLSFCNGYLYSYDLATNSVVPGIGNNFPGYIISMNSSARIPARQVCDPKFNLPQYGWSASKLINEFRNLTGLPLGNIQGFIGRFMGTEAQQTTYNFGFCVNLAARNILIGLLGANYDPTKYTQFRIEQTSYFVSTDILDYVTANYLDFSY